MTAEPEETSHPSMTTEDPTTTPISWDWQHEPNFVVSENGASCKSVDIKYQAGRLLAPPGKASSHGKSMYFELRVVRMHKECLATAERPICRIGRSSHDQ